MIAVAFVVGGAVAAALFAALINRFGIGSPYPKFIALDGPYFSLFLKFGLGIVAACFIIIKLRQPRGARIEWNDWGFTEWDGDSVRCAIERAKLRVGTLVTKMQGKGMAGVAAQAALQRDQSSHTIGVALTLGDDEGRRIYIGEGTQLAWLGDRLSSTSDLTEVRKALEGVPSMPPDIGRDAENRRVGVWLLAIISYVTAILAAMAIVVGNGGEPVVLAMLAAAVLFGLLRALVPRWGAFRIARAARNLIEPVTLLSHKESLLMLQTKDGQTRQIDVQPLKHLDGGLAERRGAGWASKSFDALETDAARSARKSRILAFRLEFWGRLLLPLAALALLGSQLKDFEKWKVLATGGAQPVQTVLIGPVMLRGDGANVELVYDTGKKALALHGPAELFTQGPSETLAFQKDGVLQFHKFSFDGSGWDMNPKKDGAAVKLPRARLIATGKERVFIVSDSGVGELWQVQSIDLALLATLPTSMASATAAVLDDDKLFVGMDSGSIEIYSLTGQAAGTIADPTQRAAVRSMALNYSVLAVATSAGVTLYDTQTKTQSAQFLKSGIITIAYGSYPSRTHAVRGGLLVLTAEGILYAIDDQGMELRHFDLHLPKNEKPTSVSTTRREVRVCTDHGALYQLWIG